MTLTLKLTLSVCARHGVAATQSVTERQSEDLSERQSDSDCSSVCLRLRHILSQSLADFRRTGGQYEAADLEADVQPTLSVSLGPEFVDSNALVYKPMRLTTSLSGGTHQRCPFPSFKNSQTAVTR